MDNDDPPFDPFQTLIDHAELLNSIRTPAKSPKVFYEFMSGGLVWSDETVIKHDTAHLCDALRYIFAYRTGLILNEPRDEFKPIWDHAVSLFPQWVGFRPERSQATPALLAVYRRGNVSLRWCLRKMERQTDETSKNSSA